MKYVFPILIFISVAAKAQNIKGVILDDENGEPIQSALLYNSRMESIVYADSNGNFNTKAIKGDKIVVIHSGYYREEFVVDPRKEYYDVRMKVDSRYMDEVVVKPKEEQIREEHQEMLKTYRKNFEDAERKPKVDYSAGTSAGVTVTGLFTNLAATISGQKKRDKRFKEEFDRMQTQKLVDLKYNPDAVTAATGTTTDSAVTFINANPIEPDFALAASHLELTMWIREHFEKWIEDKVKPATIRSTR